MFSIQKVVERVTKTLETSRFSTEDDIHNLYRKEMLKELSDARELAKMVRARIQLRRASNEEKKWVMVSMEDQAACDKELAQLVEILR